MLRIERLTPNSWLVRANLINTLDLIIERSTTYNRDIQGTRSRERERNGRKVQSAEIAKDRRFGRGLARVDGKVSWFDLCAGNETSGQWRNAAEPLLETRYMHDAPRRYKGTANPAQPSPIHRVAVPAASVTQLLGRSNYVVAVRSHQNSPDRAPPFAQLSASLFYLALPTYAEFSTHDRDTTIYPSLCLPFPSF